MWGIAALLLAVFSKAKAAASSALTRGAPLATDAAQLAPPEGLAAGVDVSKWQGAPNWDALQRNGVKFAVVKATQALFLDPQFRRNQVEARRTMRRVGYFHFFKFAVDPVKQARLFVRAVGPLEPGEFLVFDGEERGKPKAAYLQRMAAFLEYVTTATGQPPMIYTSPSMAREYGFGARFGARHALWVAHWGKGASVATRLAAPTIPAGWSEWTLWQYAKGPVPGAGGTVYDLDAAAPGFVS